MVTWMIRKLKREKKFSDPRSSLFKRYECENSYFRLCDFKNGVARLSMRTLDDDFMRIRIWKVMF